jgi:hypothetical protein
MIKFEQVEVGKRYLERVIDSEFTEEEKKENDNLDIFVIAKTEDALYVLLNCNFWIKHFPNEIEQIKKLTVEDLRNSKSYDISPEIDEEIVVYDYIKEKIFTCLGFEIEIKEEIID